MKIKGLWVILLAPCCLAWNGQGEGQLSWAPEAHAPGVPLSVQAVGAVHEDSVEAVLILPIPGLTGDGVLSVRVRQSLREQGPVPLPTASVRLRLREYDADGNTLFRGLRIEAGTLSLAGPSSGPLRVSFDAVFSDGLQIRHLKGDFDLIPIEAERDEYTDPETGEEDVVYHAHSGCYGTWDEEEDDPDEVDWEEEDSESGCGGDDLDDDGPSGSGSGCDDEPSEGEEFESPEGADDSGCEGDNVDSDSSDSGCDCSGDDIDTAALGCARGGGPRSPWIGRLVGWLPWFTVFAFLGVLRLRARRRPGAAMA